jgi:class 3 adenylate cyclase
MNHKNTETDQEELEKRAFYLSTLFDISKDIFGKLDAEAILRNFLLMTMGNFGVTEGFILIINLLSKETTHFISTGFQNTNLSKLEKGAKQILLQGDIIGSLEIDTEIENIEVMLPNVTYALPFSIDAHNAGLMGLGSKLIAKPYAEDEKKLLATMVNSMVIALQNAKSFEEIKQLNADLLKKKQQLEKTVTELQAAMKKVELLEGIKTSLRKFVPTAISRLIEDSGTAAVPRATEQDVSVLFLDIEGYTELSEMVADAELNEIIEMYFSVFLESIYEHNGDVNETAGDSLMVLFLNDDKITNALEAVRTALSIRDKAGEIKLEYFGVNKPMIINMGINSGPALVGTAKFESYSGSRWTYTARGMTTNLAARIGSLASGGQILLAEATAKRVGQQFPIHRLGRFALKNVSEELEIFILQ